MDMKSEIAGSGFPARFLLWDKLDTLALTLNFLQGNLPTDTQIADYMRQKEGAATWVASKSALLYKFCGQECDVIGIFWMLEECLQGS